MKTITEWERAWHNSLKYPKHGDLLKAVRDEAIKAYSGTIKSLDKMYDYYTFDMEELIEDVERLLEESK